MVASEKSSENLISSDREAEAYECLVMSRGTFVVLWLALASATCNYTNILWEHRCEAGSEVFACSIPLFLYFPKENISRVIQPNGSYTQKIRIHKVHYINRFNILAYDGALHNELKRPRAIQLKESRVRLVEIPIDLEYGDFADGYVWDVVVPPAETTYPLRYLDLSDNMIANILNLTTLVKLETLNLMNNRISHIPKDMFLRMTNLTTLIISQNRIVELYFKAMPPRLEMVFAHNNVLTDVDFTGAYLPVLEELTLNYGFLTDLDVTALLKAAPKLKEIRLNHNQFGLEREINISATLKAAGVAHGGSFGEQKTDQNVHGSDSDSEDDEYYDKDDDSFYRDRKAQFWEHTFAWLLAITNSIVLVWATVGFYREKQQPKSCSVIPA